MKIYHIEPDKSRITWSGVVGNQTITGEINASEGSFVSELGQVIGGNVTVDLATIKVTDSSLTKEQRSHMEKQIKSFPMTKDKETLAQYNIERVIPQDDMDLIKGLLSIGNQAFGVDVLARFDQNDDQLSVRAKAQVEKSSPILIQELDDSFKDQLSEDKSIESLNLNFDLKASLNERAN
jgi:hypothetical protein